MRCLRAMASLAKRSLRGGCLTCPCDPLGRDTLQTHPSFDRHKERVVWEGVPPSGGAGAGPRSRSDLVPHRYANTFVPLTPPARAASTASAIRRGVSGRHQQLRAEVLERIVDGVGDGGGGRDGAALAQALLAEARVGRGRLHVHDAHLGHLGGARQQVVGERRAERLAVRVEAHLFVERGADALGRAADDLAVDDHGVDQGAAVLDHDVVQDLDFAGLGIDGDDGGVGGVAEGARVALGLVAGGNLEAGRIDIGRQVLRAAVPRARDLGDADAARWPHHLAAFDAHILAPGLQQAGAHAHDALGELLARLRHRAAGHDHAARAPSAGGVGRLGGVAVHQADAIVREAQDRVRRLATAWSRGPGRGCGRRS